MSSHGRNITHVPRHAATCRCLEPDVIAYRDDDGDWVCSTCGHRLDEESSARMASSESRKRAALAHEAGASDPRRVVLLAARRVLARERAGAAASRLRRAA